MAHSPVHSMTGFGSAEAEVNGGRLKVEIRAVNHRFLDLKIRLPREYASAEALLRALLQKNFSRGTIDLRIDRLHSENSTASATPTVTLNQSAVVHYREALLQFQRILGLEKPPAFETILGLPDVFSKASTEVPAEDAWKQLEPLVQKGIDRLTQMRAHEGAALTATLREGIETLGKKLDFIERRRKECQDLLAEKTRERITQIFSAYPVSDSIGAVQTVLESRIAQELALILDKTDIAEEITRFRGHLAHFQKTLKEGGLVGKKLEFLLQELGREINTLGNKAQDLSVSEEVVQAKVILEQLREQTLNLA